MNVASIENKEKGNSNGSKYNQNVGTSNFKVGYSRGGRTFTRERGRGRIGARSVTCQLCNWTGHVVSQCYYRFDHDFQGFAGTNCSNKIYKLATNILTMMATLESVYDQCWYPDLGASNHVTPDATNLMTKADYNSGEKFIWVMEMVYISNILGIQLFIHFFIQILFLNSMF